MKDEIRKVKLEKLENLKKAGMEVYPEKSQRDYTNKEVLNKFDEIGEEKEIYLVGRVRSLRPMGGSAFCHIEDGSGKIQLFLNKKILQSYKSTTNLQITNKKKDGENDPLDLYKLFVKNIELGDFVQVKGILFKTKTEEKSLKVIDWKILSKTLQPFPTEHFGFKNEEERFRKRYLDIIFNPETKEIIKKRAIFWNAVREFHLKNNFMEVETPILETTTGGADARPFETHHNALDMDVYLRISAGELWQKRLMVAGFEKTFEIGRIFRNEGISPEHLQDYTQCEAYWAYSDAEQMSKFLRECYQYVIEKTFGTLQFKIRGFEVDFSGEWAEIDYAEEVKKQTGIDIWQADEKEIIAELKELKVEYEAENKARLIDSLWKYCRKNIGGPAILVNTPKMMTPLAKSSTENEKIVKQFVFLIGGSEVGQGYSELNDPIDQKERFAEQQSLRDAGDDEAQMADNEFVEALEYGMPPTAGHGFSERLFSFLINKPARECQTFPLVKPKMKE